MRAPGIAILILDGQVKNVVLHLQLHVTYSVNELIGYIKLQIKMVNNHATIFLVFNLRSVDLIPELPLGQRPLSPVRINRNAATSSMHQLSVLIFVIKRIRSVFGNEHCISLITVDPNLHDSLNSADVHCIGATT